jgi:integrase
MRRPILRIEPYRHSATSRFVIEGHRVNGKRVREFFATKKEAEARLGQLKTQIINEGTSGLSISNELRVMAASCAEKLTPFGKTLADATDFYIDHLKRNERSCTFAELVASFTAAKTKDGVSERYLNDLRSRYGRAIQDFGPRKVATIEAREIDDWLRDLPLSPQSRNNFRTVLHALFAYAEERGYCEKNAVAKTAKAKLIDKAPEIFTPQEAQALLEAALPEPEPESGAPADDTPRWLGNLDIIPALAIGLFAGLRQAEIERLDWSEVDLGRSFIEVTAEKAKTKKRRLVKMEPNLAAWLTPFVRKSGGVMPPNYRNKLDATWKKAGLEEWPDNGLRHSYASYHLAHFKDASRLALELGHGTTQMLFAHYRELVRPEDAALYWQIAPLTGIPATLIPAHA